MRIRKRFPPPSLSEVPLSDPQLNRSQVVQQHQPQPQGSILLYPHGNLRVQEIITSSQPSDRPNQPLPPPTDDQLMIGTEKTRWVCSGSGDEQQMKQKELEGEEVKDERRREEEKSNDIRKGSIFGAKVGTGILPPSGSSHQAVGRWYEGDKVVPLKKRRGSFERKMSEETITEKEKKIKAKMKSKTNKKCVQQNGDEQEAAGREIKEGIDNGTISAKKSKRGSVIMEGSRCSRVNGRGWRCCQQTLVGYSLCEHHLGKGRLRSMTSVRSRAMTNITAAAPDEKDESSQRLSSSLSLVQAKEQDRPLLDGKDNDDDDEGKPLMVTKKRMKLGMVKARSISSLLGQTNSAVVVSDNNKNSS